LVEERLTARFPAKPALELLDDIVRRRFGTAGRRCRAAQGIIHSATRKDGIKLPPTGVNN
jgi:hypothetical protein